jgi:CubicO group peptidase (beta-lactamase class C family)
MAKKSRLFKFSGITLGAVLLFVLGVEVSGTDHIYFTLQQTIFKGKLGPTIDEHTVFPHRLVEVGEPQPWALHPNYNKTPLTEEEFAFHNKYETAAFLIVKDSMILHESYFDNYNNQSLTNSWSMAKSVVGILIGCMIQDGVLESVNVEMEEFFPHFEGTGITVEHLLMMSSGMDYHENYLNPFGFAAEALYGDHLEETLKDYHPDEAPGVYFNYKSGDSQWLSLLIPKLTGKTVSAYASEKIWKTVGATVPAQWSLDKEGGVEKAFCCFNSNARDFAKIGQLWLQKGIWGKDTLVPLDYWEASVTTAPVKEKDGSLTHRYGYQWWILSGMDQPVFQCRGLNGQYILVFPEMNMVAVRLGQHEPDEKINGYDADIYTYYDMAVRIASGSS